MFYVLYIHIGNCMAQTIQFHFFCLLVGCLVAHLIRDALFRPTTARCRLGCPHRHCVQVYMFYCIFYGVSSVSGSVSGVLVVLCRGRVVSHVAPTNRSECVTGRLASRV